MSVFKISYNSVIPSKLAMILVISAGIFGLSLPVKAETVAHSIQEVKHFVVIYMENHSFDNRFGSWEGVDGRIGTYVKQVNQEGSDFLCLPQTQPNLINIPATCIDAFNNISSGFTNDAFNLADYQCNPAVDLTCDNPLDELTHHFYQEIFQINRGKMDNFVLGNDSLGAAVSYTDTTTLPLYKYLHNPNSSVKYAILDNFFHAAWGGSFLSHQWLIAARTPVWPNAVNDGSAIDIHSVVDINGMPNSSGSNNKYAPPFYRSPTPLLVLDKKLTASCNPGFGRGATPPGTICGDYAVNTIQSIQQPYKPGTKAFERLPLQTHPTIGDRLSKKGISWGYYAGGWSNANGDYNSPGWTNGDPKLKKCSDPNTNSGATFPFCPKAKFSFHHEPFNYFKRFDRNTSQGRANRKLHMRDEEEFRSLAKSSIDKCNLRPVSFVKPVWSETSHSMGGYDLEGDQHLADLVAEIESSACAKDTFVIVTYDENGGEYDHVTPPGQGAEGVFDQWGPGTRVPSMVISPLLPYPASVDHRQYDTTSILATLEERFGLLPLNSRDSAVRSLSSSLKKGSKMKPLPSIQ